MSRKRLALGFIFGALVVAGLFIYRSERPWYRGRPASFWFANLNQRNKRWLTTGPPQSAWGSGRVWVNLNNPELLKEFEPFRRMSSDAIPFLVNELEHPHSSEDSKFAQALRKRLPQKLAFLVPWPQPETEQQLLALWILGEMGSQAKCVASNILRYVAVPGLDYVAVDTLGKIGADAKDCVPVFCLKLRKASDADTKRAGQTIGLDYSRGPILQLLAKLGINAAAATPVLIDELENCRKRLRVLDKKKEDASGGPDWAPVEEANLLYTAEALCAVNPTENSRAIPYLAQILGQPEFLTQRILLGLPKVPSGQDKFPAVAGRARAARCLKVIGSEAALAVLTKYTNDADMNVAEIARQASTR